jgi:predicted Zn-dependent protease
MRLIVFILLFSMHCVGTAQNSSTSLFDLDKAIAQFDALQDKGACIKLDQTFTQLSSSHPNNWLPFYYSALVKIKLSMYKDKDAETYADQAIAAILKAKQLQLNDEVLCVESLAYSTKMSLRPVLRWFSYEQKIKQPLSEAKKLNSNNPRVYVLEAMLYHKLPSILGGSCETALPLAKKAIQFLRQQNNTQKPHWGMHSAMEVVKGCSF